MHALSPSDIAVIGAGPAGLTAAYQLAKAGKRVTVFEASPRVGGMCRSFELWGQTVDVGPHRFFSSDARVNRLWLEVIGKDYRMVDRLSRILYRDKFFHYPLRAGDALAKLGVAEAARCVASYGRARLSPPDPATFEGWVVGRFGRRLFEIFFQTYSEKLWGIRCDELDADFAAQRIKKLSLLEAAKAALLGSRGSEHKTLLDRFAYATGGTGEIYERMAAQIRQRGGTIKLSTPVSALEPLGNQVTVRTDDGVARVFDHAISSMPLTLLASRLPSVPERVIAASRALTFRNTILVFLEVDSPHLFDDQWLYIHSPELQTGRISNFRNWAPELYGDKRTTILTLEYWCNDTDAIWARDDDALIAMATRELAHTRLAGSSKVLQGKVVRVPRCYPIYRRGYRDHVAVIEKHLRGIKNVQVIGRYGSFKYNNQDHSILMGLLAAENVTGAAHDLWSVNSDDTYQEAAIIDETGLVPR